MHQQNQAGSSHDPNVRVAVIVVGYQPPNNWLKTHYRFRTVFDVVIYLENAANHDGFSRLSEGVYLQQSSRNLGVATAYNETAALARRLGCTHMLLADQDSDFSLATLTGMLTYTKSMPNAAVLSPPYMASPPLDYHGRWPLPAMGHWWFRLVRTTTVVKVTDIWAAISSGSVINLEINLRLGGFKSRYFIDLVDTEYCLRARAAGFEVKGVPVPPLTHAIGQPKHKRLVGIDLYPTYHSIERHYTLARNRVWTTRLHGGRFPGWLVYEWLAAAKLLFKVLVYEPQRIKKLRAMLRGSLAGLVQRP